MADNQVFEFVVVENGVNHRCVLNSSQGSQFEVRINDEHSYTVKDSFNLSNEVLNSRVNSSDLTLQLISRNPSGEINLQYLGTKVGSFLV